MTTMSTVITVIAFNNELKKSAQQSTRDMSTVRTVSPVITINPMNTKKYKE